MIHDYINLLIMPTCCSYCHNSGHNIRSCNDPRIWELWRSLVVTFLIPKIVSESVFTTQDKWMILGYLSVEYPENTVRAASIGIARKNHGTASYVQHHYRNHLFMHMVDLLHKILNQPIERRRCWINRFTDELQVEVEETNPIDDEVDALVQEAEVEDPVSVTWIEDRNPTPIVVEPNYPIIEATIFCIETESELQEVIECAICQEDKKTLECDTTNCGHSFCHDCITQHMTIKGRQRPPCPLCRTPITSLAVKDIENFSDTENKFGRTACILKDCVECIFTDSYQMFNWSHREIIDIIAYELMKTQHPIHTIDNVDTDLEKAEVIWRYLWANGINLDDSDITYEEFLQGMNTSMSNIENMPDVISVDSY